LVVVVAVQARVTILPAQDMTLQVVATAIRMGMAMMGMAMMGMATVAVMTHAPLFVFNIYGATG
jgi:hypothetical protein